MIVLRALTAEDKELIKRWPAYQGVFAKMDYALREGGWLDEFIYQPHTFLFAAESGDQLVGFSLLALTGDADAEFRIALHPDWTGKGVGREATMCTLEIGFTLCSMKRIHLIVRKSNPPAMKLYQSMGFAICGESSHLIQGSMVEFFNMEMFAKQCRRWAGMGADLALWHFGGT